jgi:hypothetical protein
MSIDHINNVLFAFVLIIMIIDGLLSYSSIVYGVKEVKNKYLIWLVVHTGFPGMLIFTRGAVLLLYCLFTYLCGGIYAIFFSVALLYFYICKVMNGKIS